MVFRELKSAYYDRVVLEPLKKAKNLEEAVRIVGKYYEAPAVLNMAPRLKGAQEALDLYHKLPAPADDHDVVVAALDQISHDLQEIAQKVIGPFRDAEGHANQLTESVMPIVDPPTIPWYKSQVLWGILISVLLKIVWAVFKWSPLADGEEAELIRQVTVLASFLGDAIATHGRVTATAQPVTLTDQTKKHDPLA
jgi:hypothetical protein